jgi:predicted nucleic acid-binding Zn ribbon protein
MNGREKEPVKISDVLNSVLGKYGLAEAVEHVDYVKYWREIVGSTIAERTRVDRYYRGSLTVRVANSAWLQELTFHKDLIIKRLQAEVPEGSLSDIRFIVGTVR